MIKAALFDIDGLILVGRKYMFSVRLAERLNIPIEEVTEFFLTDFKKCSFGKADLKNEMTPWLLKWGWNESFDDLLKFWFESEGVIDPEVIQIVGELRKKGIKCYIATRQEKYRFDYLMNVLGLAKYFDGSFCTCEIGFDKWQPDFFHTVFSQLNLSPEEIFFIDDSQKNIDNAKTMGIQAEFYNGIGILRKFNSSV